MDNIIRQIIIKLRAMWAFRWPALIVAWVVAVVAAMGVMSIPKKYESSARVFVNTDSILKPLMVGMTVQPDVNQRVVMLSRALLSRPNIEQLVKDAGLDDKVKTKEQFDRVVEDVGSTLQIKGGGQENLYTLSFSDTKPDRAKRVVELLVSKFIDSNAGGKTDDTESAKKFLDEQAAVYEKKLIESENKLKEFRLKNLDIEPGQGKDFASRLSALAEQLSQAQLQLREAENSREALKRGLESAEPFYGPGAVSSAGDSLAEIDSRIDVIRRNLDSLLLKYTDAYPDVVGARRTISELTEQRRQLVAEYKKNGVPLVQSSTTGTRASEQLRVSLAQAEANAASLRARVGEYSARYSRLRAMAKQLPQIDSEYADLNRDYDVNKKNYESLISRRESASISGDMQSVSGVADFRLIDPPRLSPYSKPNRTVLILASFLLALSTGVAVAYAATEWRPTFYDGSNLREVTGIPVLGTVSIVISDAVTTEKKKSLKKYLVAAAGLFGTYAVLIVAAFLFTRIA